MIGLLRNLLVTAPASASYTMWRSHSLPKKQKEWQIQKAPEALRQGYPYIPEIVRGYGLSREKAVRDEARELV